MSLLVFPGGYGGLVHTSGDRLSLSCCLRRDMLQACRRDFAVGSAGQAVLHHLMRNCRELAKALNHAELDGEIHAAGPIHPGVRVDRCDDGLLRLGNAGGEAHPIVAEGISMAMQSAWIACRLLIAMQDEIRTPEAMAALGRLYAQDWRRQFAPRLRAAALFAHVSMRPRLVTGFTPLVARFPQLLTFAARTSGKTHRLRMA